MTFLLQPKTCTISTQPLADSETTCGGLLAVTRRACSHVSSAHALYAAVAHGKALHQHAAPLAVKRAMVPAAPTVNAAERAAAPD